MKFAKWTFLIAGIYGILVTLPLFNEANTNEMFPPAVNHPEYYYGFIGTVLAWQIAFLFISRDPLKHRPFMLAAIPEKMIYAISVFILSIQGRVPGAMTVFAAIDFVLGVLFVVSYMLTGKAKGS